MLKTKVEHQQGGESVTHFKGLEIEETWLICSEEEVKRSEFLVCVSQVVSES